MSTTEMMARPTAPGSRFDLFNLPDAYYRDPAPFYKALRDNEPLLWNSDGSVLLTRYDDVKTVWRDLSGRVNRAEAYAKKFGEGPLLEHHTSSMLFRDPPDHDRLRDIVNPFFTPSSIERLRTAVREIVERLIEEVREKREIDFVAEFSSRIPIQVICDIFGVPRSDGPLIRDLGAQVLFPLNPAVSAEAIAAGHEATRKFKDYLSEHFNYWRRQPVEDMPTNIISALVAAEKRGNPPISEVEMAHMCILVLNGGHETTTNLIGLSTLALMKHPDQMALLAKEPSVIGPGVEECLRYTTPLQLQGRRTTQEVQVPSGTIPADTEVIFAQVSANRDERVFADPDRLQLTRQPNAHLAFGAGIHVCLGRPLARMEAAEALPALARHFPSMQLIDEPVFARSARFRGIQSMRVRLY
ncbi:putative cytochrome P450 hydroxylase (plasmid) [Cupriavidus sp. U2]|uniref:cytochrome P450 n=1 Tax=Cupriavidus sp. U2 TaxID=2920269 RepID=UPI001E565A62|nr:cytochrome P450 [Cupriavidus sp. U2]KAI3589246.1 putative cytochrome P450 hydroxylase [Cupriavidus sp. U2]